MNPADLSPFQSDPAAAGVLALLAAVKWRKARDAAKELYKKDRVKYLPLLIAANAGLAEEMLDRGLTEDAAAVITYLKTIAPPALVEALLARRNQVKTVAAMVKGSPAEALAAAWRIVSGSSAAGPPSTELINAADRLALSTQLPEGTDAPELRAEWKAVRGAVDATANGDWEGAKAALRGISAQSVFGGWRLFLRGVRCVHTGELETARQCFTALPLGAAAARASWAYRQVCGLPGGPDLPSPAARATYLSVLCGASVRAATAIAEADALWRKHDLVGAWTTLAPGFGRGEFPSDAPGLAGTLTSLFLANPFKRLQHAGDTVPRFWAWMARRVERPGKIPPLEEMLILLQLMRLGGPDVDAKEVMHWAERIVDLDTQAHGPDPLRAAAVWELAAASLREEDHGGDDLQPPSHPEEEDLHQFRAGALRRSMELDPLYAPRTLALLRHLAKAPGKEKELKTLGTAAADRFPDHPGILAAAGKAMLEADGGKALDLLRKARRLDPGDTETADALFERVRTEIFKKDHTNSALWEELESLAKPAPATPPDSTRDLNPGRLRWIVKLRRALLDPQLAGRPEALEAALATAPSVFLGHLALCLLRDVHTREEGTTAFPSKASAKNINWQDLGWVSHLFHWRWMQRATGEAGRIWRRGLDEWLCGIAAGLFNPRTLVQEENAKAALIFARTVFSLTQQYYILSPESLPGALILEVAKTVADPIGRNRHYQLALASILLPVSCRAHTVPCSCRELAAIQRAAEDAGDLKSAQLADRLIGLCGTLSPPFWTRLRGKSTKAKAKAKAKAKKTVSKKAAVKKSAAGTEPDGNGTGAAVKKTTAKKAATKKKKATKKASGPKKQWSSDDTKEIISEFMARLQRLDQPDLFGGS
ncbi:MAG: hypothetical protein JWM59_1251 [Verrucomicrobiales bacterium]|nr:hypothetical protein [Verrucomicrobiales bacterium]